MTPPTTPERVPELHPGDRLTAAEFERRYAAMPHLKKAELIDGVVYMSSAVSTTRHGTPDFRVTIWLGHYQVQTPGVEGANNATIRLDNDNVPQPDAFLRIREDLGGQSRISDDGYVEGAPELVVEVAASSVSYDLHTKLHTYRRHGVREYVVWRVDEAQIDWFVLREGQYDSLRATPAGRYESTVFPGLWLDPRALLDGDMARVLSVVDLGLETDEHATFLCRDA